MSLNATTSSTMTARGPNLTPCALTASRSAQGGRCAPDLRLEILIVSARFTPPLPLPGQWLAGSQPSFF